MKMEQVLKSFMVDLEVDSKNASVAGQALDLCIKLVTPEYAHSPWNRYKESLLFFEQRQVLYSVLWVSLQGSSSPNLPLWPSDRDPDPEPLHKQPPACLVREVMEIPYLKVVFVLFSCVCTQWSRTMPEPYRKMLPILYKGLHTGLGQPISDNCTMRTKPDYPGVYDQRFSSVKMTFTEEILNLVSVMAADHGGSEEADQSHAAPHVDCPGQAEDGLWP